MPSPNDDLVGTIGVSQGMISQQQLDQAMSQLIEFERRGQPQPLSHLLKAMGALSEAERLGLERAARYRRERDADKAIARLIVDSGYAEARQVDAAIEQQKSHYRQTGEILRLAPFLQSQGALSEAQRIAAERLWELGAANMPPGGRM